MGKARDLRSRVRSYFQPGTSDVRAFVARLDAELVDLETFVTGNEKEAALLEQQLVKTHKPRYNIKLRDDKDYLSLRLDPKKSWPRLEVVRRPKADGAMYFGPYHSATSARQTLRLINRHFQLRTCTDSELRNRVRPCLQHQIKRCPAPCVLEVDPEEYAAQVLNVGRFLEGRHDELIDDLGARMARASSEERYELAATYRDQIRAVDTARQTQHVASVQKVDQDAIGLFRQADQAQIAVLVLRAGRLLRVQTYDLKDVAVPNDEAVAGFVRDYYTQGAQVPDEILVPVKIEAAAGLAELLSDARNRRMVISQPQRGNKARLVELAQQNAQHAFEEKRRAQQDLQSRLSEIKERLRLDVVPTSIECVDISHIGGEQTAAVFVRIDDGEPARQGYRSFKVKTVEGGDDYGALYEVISRRLRRGRDGDDKWTLPTLLLVDGGKGQLAVAERARSDLSMNRPALASIAKERINAAGETQPDRVFVPGQKNAIAVHSSPALALLALARDEAHRASNRLRMKAGANKQLRSGLDAISGVGPKTKSKLLTALGSVDAISKADKQTLIDAGANRKQAEAISKALRTDAEADAIHNAFIPE